MGEANLKLARGDYEEAAKMCLEIIRLGNSSFCNSEKEVTSKMFKLIKVMTSNNILTRHDK